MELPPLYLASSSPRRRELLTQIGLPFRLVRQDVDEVRLPGEAAGDYVTRLAYGKARAGLQQLTDVADAIVLGSDTSVVLAGSILGKPRDAQDAAQMLSRLSGQWHEVYTAVSVVSRDASREALSRSKVRFRSLSEAEITAYCASGEPLDKAGSYAIQGTGAMFVEYIEGSYSGIVGLPIVETMSLLSHWGYTPDAVLGVPHEF